MTLQYNLTQKLVCRSVVREDGGMYQCLAVNEDEESQAAAQLVLGNTVCPTSRWVSTSWAFSTN